MNDAEYLRRYSQEGSEEAFAELVRNRIALVYSAALRQTGGDAHRAQEVTQAVFTDLARKAADLCRHQALIGWLYTSTRFAAGKLAGSEHRRQTREQTAYLMQTDLAPNPSEIPAEKLRPLLDEAMHQLSEPDRRALLLRFFDGCSMAEIGTHFHVPEATAKKRVERALDKLRTVLARRGLSSTAAAVGLALAQEVAAATAPAGLTGLVSGHALAAAALAAPSAGLIAFFAASKLTTAVFGLMLAAAIGTIVYEVRLSRQPVGGFSGDRVAAAEPGHLPAIEVVDPSKDPTAESEAGEAGGPLTTGPRTGTTDIAPPAVAVGSSTPAIVPPVPGAVGMSEPPTAPPGGPGAWAALPPVFPAAQLDQQPIPLSQPPPDYPAELRAQGVSGQVLVEFTVDATGRVRNPVATGSDGAEFKRAALAAVSRWTFTPGRKGGQAVSTRLEAPIHFTLHPHD